MGLGSFEGLGIWGLGFWGLGICGLGFRYQGLGFGGGYDLWFRVQGSGFRIRDQGWGLELRV